MIHIEHWIKLTAKFKTLYPNMPIVGDDLYTTNKDTVQRGIQEKWANAMLLKVNQIGTIIHHHTIYDIQHKHII